tara:strand:+ start:8222 stop:8875 length:654 start_codon:yes stop_codon:yes gene_type:complete
MNRLPQFDDDIEADINASKEDDEINLEITKVEDIAEDNGDRDENEEQSPFVMKPSVKKPPTVKPKKARTEAQLLHMEKLQEKNRLKRQEKERVKLEKDRVKEEKLDLMKEKKAYRERTTRLKEEQPIYNEAPSLPYVKEPPKLTSHEEFMDFVGMMAKYEQVKNVFNSKQSNPSGKPDPPPPAPKQSAPSGKPVPQITPQDTVLKTPTVSRYDKYFG